MLARLLRRRAGRRDRAPHRHAARGRSLGLELRLLSGLPFSANAQTAPRPPSTRPAPNLRMHGNGISRSERKRIFKHGATSETGRRRNIAALIGANGCRRTGNRHGARVADRSSLLLVPPPLAVFASNLLRTKMYQTTGVA